MTARAAVVWFVLVAGGALVDGCAAPSNSSAPSPFLAFTPGPAPTIYSGSIVDSVKGSGTLKVSLNDAAGLISGTWEMSFSGKADPLYTISGPDGSATYTATVSTCKDNGFGENCSSSCAFRFTGSLTGSSLTGTYSATSDQSCLGRTGSVNTTKQ